MRALLSVFLLTIAGCGSYSMPGIDGEPDARGTWDMNFVPASPSPGAPTPAGMSLTIQIAQNGQTAVRYRRPRSATRHVMLPTAVDCWHHIHHIRAITSVS